MVKSQTAGMPRPRIECLPGGVLACVVVCRLLTPTDAAPTGETLWIAQAALLGLLVWACVAYRSNLARLQFNRLRVNWVDAAAGLFCLGHVIGSLAVIATSGDKRAAMTMLWEWVGLAVTWFLMRTQLFLAVDRKAMLVVVAAAAVSLSALGIWQHHFGYAESRREYETLKSEYAALEKSGRPNDPQKAVAWDRAMQKARAELVRLDIPANESARMLWEQRLYSSEPIGMFALANTLAGVLVCASILWLATLMCAGRTVPAWNLALGVILVALVLYCLLLTKSRTAFVGLACGLGLWGTVWVRREIMGIGAVADLTRDRRGGDELNSSESSDLQKLLPHPAVALGFRRAGRRRIWPALGAAVIILAVLVGVAAATGGLDRLVLSESTKSLRYRFEYWRSTCQMLMDSPQNWLLGVGPGNFRQHYLQFKLPQSSEEIADPHNLVLDVWANGGLIALVGLAGICFAGLRPLWLAMKAEAVAGGTVSDLEETPHSVGAAGGIGILAGAILGHLVVLLLGLGSEETLVLLVLGWILVVIASAMLFRNEPVPSAYGAAFAALLVHLLGAGGIGMPAITQMLLLCVALAETASSGETGESAVGWTCEIDIRLAGSRIGLAGLALFLGCWFTGLAPNLDEHSMVSAGKFELFEKRNPSKAERDFQHAAKADPWSSTPYERLAELAFQRWQASSQDRPEEFKRSVKSQQEAIARDPRNAGGYRTLGEMHIVRFQRTGDRADASTAVEALRQAVFLYPNFALGQSQLAEALHLAGRRDEARQAAQRALDLDAINQRAGHLDKRLPGERRELMVEIVAERAKLGP